MLDQQNFQTIQGHNRSVARLAAKPPPYHRRIHRFRQGGLI